VLNQGQTFQIPGNTFSAPGMPEIIARVLLLAPGKRAGLWALGDCQGALLARAAYAGPMASSSALLPALDCQKREEIWLEYLAPRAGLEPATQRLTAACSTN
jgi:hypothetical protein